MPALVIAEHDNESIKSSTLNTITAAVECAAEVHVLVAGHDCAGAADCAARIDGVSHVYVANAKHLAEGLAENIAEQALALADGYSHILVPATAYGRNIAPRVAAKLDVGQVSDIVRVVSHDTFERPVYAGNVLATVQSVDHVKVITVRTTAFDAAGGAGSATIECVAPVDDFGRTRFVSREVVRSDRPELTGARIVVAGGRGLGSADNFRILEPLADKLDAALGASRAAVDAGFAPNDWQVGQTGKIVAPQLYVAVGISGAIQHLAGMKDSKVIVAINKDAEAPIFSIADYGLVGDLFDLVPQLAAELG
nr:FAD-binding protein [Burkholderia ambifaria]